MRNLAKRLLVSRAGRLFRRLCRACVDQRQTTVFEEMLQGAVVGLIACGILAEWIADGGIALSSLALFSSLGMFAGGVIGVILWIGSADLPEDRILAPAPGQSRLPPSRRS